MNFIEACVALREGRCDKISREQWNGKSYCIRYNGSLLYMNERLDTKQNYVVTLSTIDIDDWILVNKKPQLETVEVVRWMCPHCFEMFAEPNKYACCIGSDEKFVKLTGTYQVPVKPKVKRREYIGHYDCLKHSNRTDVIPAYALCYAEWEE